MQHYVISGCTSCGTLRDVYDRIECTILAMGVKKWTNAQYNTALSFDQELFNDLVRYRRVVGQRLYNPSYPCSSIDIQDIITQALSRAYKAGDCSQCTTCFPAGDTTSTTSSSSSTTTTIV